MRASSELSPREKQVLTMIWDNLSVKETAAALGIAVSTVHHCRTNINLKLGVNSQIAACRRGLELGYLEVKFEAPTV